MSDMTTIARPYAKALFEHALVANELTTWSTIIHALAHVVRLPDVMQFISNPASTATQQTTLLMTAFPPTANNALLPSITNVVMMLAHNKRLLVLPDIAAQYESLRAEQEKTVVVHVTSFSSFSSIQQEQLSHSLGQRLKRAVTLHVTIDKSLLGGAVIHAGDLVIDGSVRGKLTKLGADLLAA